MATLILRHHGKEERIPLTAAKYGVGSQPNGNLLVTDTIPADLILHAWLEVNSPDKVWIIPLEPIRIQPGNTILQAQQLTRLADGATFTIRDYELVVILYETVESLIPASPPAFATGDGKEQNQRTSQTATGRRAADAPVRAGSNLNVQEAKGIGVSDSPGKSTRSSKVGSGDGYGSSKPPAVTPIFSTSGMLGGKQQVSFGAGAAGTKVGGNLLETGAVGPATAAKFFAAPSAVTTTSATTTPAATTLERCATVRYFKRMYPFHTYPVRTVLSARQLRQIKMQGVAQATGDTPFAIAAAKPYVTVIPIFPGAMVAPESLTIDVTPDLVETEFWVTPQTEGRIGQARVEIHYEGKVMTKVATPYRVTKHTLAKISLACSVLFPWIGPLLKYYQLDLESQLVHGFPMLRPVLDAIMQAPRVTIFAAFALLALLLYWWSRPKESDPVTEFLSLATAMEDGDKALAAKGSSQSSLPGKGGSATPSKAQADALYDQAFKYNNEGKSNEALELYDKALPIYRPLGMSYDLGSVLCNIASILMQRREYDRALATYAEEQGVWIHLGKEAERGRCLSNLGILFQYRQEYERSVVFLREAIEVRKNAGDRKGQLYSLEELARSYRLNKNFAEALQVCSDLEKLLGDTDEPRRAYLYHMQGLIAYDSASYEQAIAYYEKALNLYKTLGMMTSMADDIFNLGLCYRAKKEKKLALEFFQKSREAYQAAGLTEETNKWAGWATDYIKEIEQW